MQAEQYLVFILKIQIDCGRTIFNEVGDLADRDLVKPLFHEQFHGSLQDQFPDLQLLFFFTFWDAHIKILTTQIYLTL